MRELKDAVIFITGGSSGMGLAAARRLKARGARVIIASRREAALKAAIAETGADGYVAMDIARAEDWDRARDMVMDKYGRIDILLNVAGGGVAIVDYLDQRMDQIKESIDLNLYGAMYGARAFAPIMKAQRSGLIVNVLSVCATHAWAGFSVYSAAKAGLRMFGKCLYLELQPYNVKVTSFIPAGTNTNFAVNCGCEPNNLKLSGPDIADALDALCRMEDHVWVEEMTVWGIDQEVGSL